MKKLVLIYNPVSGKAVFKHRLDEIIHKFQQNGCIIIPYRTTITNEGLVDFIKAVAPDGLIAAGGDGTLHQVVNMVKRENLDLPVGIIGSGTSNDFATYLNLDTEADGYFSRIAEGVTRKVDLGKVGDQYFINVASAGMATSIAHEVDVRLKNAIGKLAYYIHGITSLPKFRPLNLHIKTREDEFDVKAFLFLVVGSGVVASFKQVAVKAEVDDGRLDLIIVKYCNMQTLMTITAELMSGKAVSEQSNIIYIQSDWFEISADEELDSDLDGELGPKLPLTIEAIPKAIELYV